MDTLNIPSRAMETQDASPLEVVEKMRSITLLEGYDHVIHLRKLREGQEQSPYDFHLALASYFHCVDDEAEEERQLSKALSLRGAHVGYESVRRLADLWVRQMHHARAEVVLKAYLNNVPEALEQLLEPVVRVAIGLDDYDHALEVLAPFEDNFRTQLLRAEIYRAQGDECALATVLHTMHREILDSLSDKISILDPADTVGWGRADDPRSLQSVLASLLPELDLGPLEKVSHAVWPNIGGYPDFAPDMAWLSYTLGELGKICDTGTPEVAKSFREFAEFLGYPSRLEKHLERDEYWFWMRESQSGKRVD